MSFVFKALLLMTALGIIQAAIKGRSKIGKSFKNHLAILKLWYSYILAPKVDGQGNQTEEHQEREKRHKFSPFEWSWSNPLFGYQIMLLKINGPGKKLFWLFEFSLFKLSICRKRRSFPPNSPCQDKKLCWKKFRKLERFLCYEMDWFQFWWWKMIDKS